MISYGDVVVAARETLQELLEGSKQYQVPLYQRTYSFRPFLEDSRCVQASTDRSSARYLRSPTAGRGETVVPVLRPRDFYRKLSGRRLHEYIEALRSDVDYFVSARGLQVEGWELGRRPTTRDALEAVTSAAVQSGRSVRALGDKVVDMGLAGISQTSGAVQTKVDKARAGRRGADSAPAPDEHVDHSPH